MFVVLIEQLIQTIESHKKYYPTELQLLKTSTGISTPVVIYHCTIMTHFAFCFSALLLSFLQ